jgi:hypothetical protein
MQSVKLRYDVAGTYHVLSGAEVHPIFQQEVPNGR